MNSETPSATNGSVAQVYQATQASILAVGRLAGSELELAGAALLRAALFATLASACLASASVMVLLLITSLLLWAGLALPAAIALTLLIAIGLAAVFGMHARRLLRYCRLHATRKQLAAMLAPSPERGVQ